MSTETIVRAVIALQAKPQSITSLYRETGMTPGGAERLMARLLENRFVEFKGYSEQPERGRPQALYVWRYGI